MPEKEWPTRTVGPFCRASTRSAEATASGSVVKGFCTDVTFSPAACKRGITSDQEEPSANRPCTSTTLPAFGGVAFAAMSRVEISEAAAPASTAVENVRLFIIMILFLHGKSCVWSLSLRRAPRYRPDAGMFDVVSSFTAFLPLLMQALRSFRLEQRVDVG